MFTQLDHPIPLHVIDDGYAFAFIGNGPGHNLIWVQAISESGEILCAPNHSDRMQLNSTLGRPFSPAIEALKCKAGPVNFRGEDNPSLKEVA